MSNSVYLPKNLGSLLLLISISYPGYLYPALKGNYTLNPVLPASSTNYRNLTSFAQDLSSGTRTDGGVANGAGVSGPVLIRLSSAITLTEQVEFRSVAGASVTNTIKVKGSLSTLQFTATSATSKHTIWFNGAKYFTIDSLNVRANAPVLAWGIRFSNDANFNNILNSTILVPNITTGVAISTTSTSVQAAICFTNSSSILDYTAKSATSGGTNGSDNKIMNCTIGGASTTLGPTYGIFDTQTDSTGNNSYINNKIQHFYQEGLSCFTTDGITITGNDVNRLGNTTTPGVALKGINLYNNVRCMTKPISAGNNIIHDITTTSTIYGFYYINSVTYIPLQNGGSQSVSISNNKVYNLSNSTTLYGMYFSNIRNSGGYTVKNNEIFKNSNTSTMYVLYNNNSDKLTLNANIIRNNKAATLYCLYDLGSSTNSWFTNNLLFKNVATGIEYGLRLAGTGIDWVGNNYSNNTVAFDSVGWVSTTTYGMYIDGGIGFPKSNNKIYNNNIFIGHKGASSTVLKYGIYNLDGYSGYTEAGNNVYFDTLNVSPATTYYGSEYSGTLNNLATLTAWINMGFSSKDYNQNPKFIKSTYSDYRINNPKLFKMGANADVAIDIGGVKRIPGSPDIGAFELPFNLKYDLITVLDPIVCSGSSKAIQFRVYNSTAYTFRDIELKISINGLIYASEVLPVVKVGFTTYTFSKPFQMSSLGNKIIKIYSANTDEWSYDDTATTQIYVIASPGGSIFALKSGSGGIMDHQLGYDVSALDDSIIYEFSPPRGHQDIDYGITWSMKAWAEDSNANDIQGPYFSWVHPSTTELTFNPAGDFVDQFVTIVVYVRDMLTGCDTVYRRKLFIAPKADIKFNVPKSVCFLTDVDFINNSTISSGGVEFTWDFGDGSDIYHGKFAKHNYAAAGKYMVKLSAVSVPFGFVKDSSFIVEVVEIPKANFTKTNACEGNNIILTNTSSANFGTPTYKWDMGDGSPIITKVNVTKIYASPGVYTVTLTASKGGCENSISKNVYQFVKPVANFEKASGSCLNTSLEFDNTSGITIGHIYSLWNFDDAGNTSTDRDPSYTFLSSGNKNVKLVITSEFGCKDSIIKVVSIQQSPITDFTFTDACDATPTNFSNASNLYNEKLQDYSWDFGDGSSSSAVNPVKLWAGSGIRTVKLTTTLLNGCSSEISKTVDVGIQPDVDFAFNDACSGNPVNFENLTDFNPSRIIYHWSFGDMGFSTDNSATHTYNTSVPQTFTVKLKGSVIKGCSDSVSKTITISALPSTCNFDIVGNVNAAMKTKYAFVPKGGTMAGTTYTWATGDGNTLTSNATGVNYTYTAPGVFCVKMIARNAGGCQCEATKCMTLTTDIASAEIMNNALFIYPNPGNGLFNVKVYAAINEMTLSVYNSSGMLVRTVHSTGSEADLDLSEFASGVYIVKIIADNYLATRKITISR